MGRGCEKKGETEDEDDFEIFALNNQKDTVAINRFREKDQ